MNRASLIAAACAALTPSVHVQVNVPADAGTTLPAITVSGARSERALGDVPAVISVRDAETLEDAQVRDIRALEREEPNLSIRRAPTRFTAAGASTGRPGNEGFNIRGLEGNRVLIQVDGVRLPNAFSFGANAFGRGDWLDLSTLSRVEILRGPASTLYGSDGLAGVVSFYTLDPEDLLRRTGRDTALTAGVGYAHEDRGFTVTGGGAARLGRWEALAIVTRRDAHELANQGTLETNDLRRTAPDPQDIGSTALLAKLVHRISDANRLRFTLDVLRRSTETDALSARAAPPLTATSVVGLTADDRLERITAIVDQRIDRLGWVIADSLRWNLYWQDTDARQDALEDRLGAADRRRDTRYDERSIGAGVGFERRIDGPIDQRIVWGADVASTRYVGLRDGVVPPAGERYPTKSFPDTEYRLFGAYLQDELSLAGGRLTLVPGIRWDHYRYDADPSPLYPQPVADASSSRLSPRLGAVLRLGDEHSVFANLASGFRAPTADQINNGFTNPVANYRSIANPDLRPETSRTLELGARRAGPSATWTASAFTGRYRDFIDQRQVSGSFRPADPAVFQFVNAGDVRIDGVEATGWLRPAPSWRLLGGGGWVRGENRANGRPLNSVDPWRIFAGADWTPIAGATLGLRVTHAAGKSADDIDSAALLVTAPATQFAPPSYTTIDLLASWQVNRVLRLSAGLFNLTDRSYWRWTDVRGLSSSSPFIDAYTQPGRSLAVTARIDL